MALGKVDPKKVFKTVSLQDPAIDEKATGKENLKEFSESYKMELLKFKEGEHPTIFHIMNILSSDEARIKQDHLKVEFPELANATPEALKDVKIKELKPTVKQINGNEMMIKYFNAAVSVYSEDNKEFPCNANLFPFIIAQEIGAVVMMRGQIGEDLKNVLGS